ncbi:MAG: hypothetical protein ABEI32_06715 [Halothece sp.]
MKRLIIVGIILFLFLVGNTVIAKTCENKGKIPYQNAENNFALLKNDTNNIQHLKKLNSYNPQQEDLPIKFDHIEQDIAQLNQILDQYQQVPECSSYYIEADRQISKIREYLKKLNQMISEA